MLAKSFHTIVKQPKFLSSLQLQPAQRVVRPRTALTPHHYACSRHRHLSTYYDSQSGMHVPVHKEEEVSAFVSLATAASEKVPLLLAQHGRIGIRFVLSREENTTNYSILREAISEAKSGDTEFLLPSVLLKESDSMENILKNKNATVLFEYSSAADTESLAKDISTCVETSIATGIICPCGQDPVEMANGVAQILDDTGGGKYLHVLGDDSDSIVEVCEELSYLDVTGPTLKSRIIVDVAKAKQEESEETVEECLMMGINKFVVEEDRLDWLDQLVQDQGKTCTFGT